MLDLMHLLSFILATWFLFTLTGLPINNHGFACSDLTVWTEVDPSVEDHAFFEDQADQP